VRARVCVRACVLARLRARARAFCPPHLLYDDFFLTAFLPPPPLSPSFAAQGLHVRRRLPQGMRAARSDSRAEGRSFNGRMIVTYIV
jgi:hypothetical protein